MGRYPSPFNKNNTTCARKYVTMVKTVIYEIFGFRGREISDCGALSCDTCSVLRGYQNRKMQSVCSSEIIWCNNLEDQNLNVKISYHICWVRSLAVAFHDSFPLTAYTATFRVLYLSSLMQNSSLFPIVFFQCLFPCVSWRLQSPVIVYIIYKVN
jgi:hypothetical protein